MTDILEPRTGRTLDNPVLAALTGPHASVARTRGRAVRYDPDFAPFAAFDGEPDEAAWADLAALTGPGVVLALPGCTATPPAGWELVERTPAVQMIDATVDAVEDPEAVELGPDDVAEMRDLVARTEPGPFRPRTAELGRYLGIRRGGTLIAMAGERMHPPGWTEISAVCTDHSYRGQGLGGRLVRAVAAGIRARGETPFLHAKATNVTAIRLYEALGFTLRRETQFPVVKTL